MVWVITILLVIDVWLVSKTYILNSAIHRLNDTAKDRIETIELDLAVTKHRLGLK